VTIENSLTPRNFSASNFSVIKSFFIQGKQMTSAKTLWVGCVAISMISLGAGAAATSAAQSGSLRVGAARVDITPAEGTEVRLSGYGGRTEPFEGIQDRLYYRAIVIDDGASQVALVVGDVIGISHEHWETISARIEDEHGIPRTNLLLCGTHTHGGPNAEYLQSEPIANKLISAVAQAKANLQPARIGIGKGYCNVNVSRRARTALGNSKGGWWLGQNPDGPADKTMHVIKFESLDRKPIAILANYAAHGTTMGQDNRMVTADHPGACSRFVEEQLGGDAVVAWTSGAAGDLDPIYAYQRSFRDKSRIGPVEVLGRIQGEEVLRVVEGLEMTDAGRVRTQQLVIAAPGRKNVTGLDFHPDGDYEFIDAPPVEIRLTLLRIGDLALCGVSGEVLTLIGQRLKERSPLPHTVMVTHANGGSGYLPNDEAYDNISYEILVTQVKPGVEKLLIVNLLDMLRQDE
jgi:neutral ceramidase